MCAVRKHSVVLQLHPWKTGAEEVQSNVGRVADVVEQTMKEGEGGSVKVVGAKSVVAAMKGLALAEEKLGGAHESLWGGEGAMTCVLERQASDFHTFVIKYTKEGFAFPESARVTDVIDKSELTEDLFQWAAATPSNYWTDEPLTLDFDKNSPEYSKPYHVSASEFMENLLAHPKQESLLRGMGPSIFNCVQVLAHANNCFDAPLRFSPRHVPEDDASIAVFKENIRDYFERGMVHFRDQTPLPARRADGKILTPPEGFDETDYFTVGFGVRV